MPETNITKIPIEKAAKILTASFGRKVTDAEIREDIDDGAPVNDDGSISLPNYAAWLVRETRD